MPIYLFQNGENGEIKEILQGMNEPHTYSENGIKWNRVFTKPTASVNATITNPFSAADFRARTESKSETIGSLMDRSKEYSEKRKDKLGVKIDPAKKRFWDNWSKERKGKKPPARYLE
jgi:predicted nucleic acid-binding Zn ribbon protein